MYNFLKINTIHIQNINTVVIFKFDKHFKLRNVKMAKLY